MQILILRPPSIAHECARSEFTYACYLQTVTRPAFCLPVHVVHVDLIRFILYLLRYMYGIDQITNYD